MPTETRLDKTIYELQDGGIDLKRVQEAIKKTGADLEERFDARLAETLYPGRVAKRSENFLKTEVRPLLQAMALLKVDMTELGDYLIARHAPERNAQIAKINPALLLKYFKRAELNPFDCSGKATMALLGELVATASILSRGD